MNNSFRLRIRLTTCAQIRIAPFVWSFLFLLSVFYFPAHAAEPSAPPPAGDNAIEIIGAFNNDQAKESEAIKISDQKKRLVMFIMGVPLLTFIIITAALGVAMGVYGKPVYVVHMVFAGLSVTLAIAHAIVGIVWFYPF